MLTHPGWVEPEVYFRIVHVAEGGHHGAPLAPCREHTVEIARQEGITRARATQVMGMLRLAPEIQEQILSIPDVVRRSSISERMLRPIGTLTDRRDQIRELHKRLE